MSKPKLSIGLPVYNGERYLRQTLDSLLGQEFQDLELIISDNGSSDGTAAICEAYAKADKRVRYYRSNTNQGATWNYRRVLELAEGTYFKAQAPYQRLSRVIFRNMHGPAIYGVIKTEVLRKTRPFGSIAADWVKLVELFWVARLR
jgi:glycosyltransferase involved in cell wall biosynthesis